mgnify:CR=1 FL=1
MDMESYKKKRTPARRKSQTNRRREIVQDKYGSFLRDTITITPYDIALQMLSWLYAGEEGAQSFIAGKMLSVSLGADDLADAYHGTQMPLHSWEYA